MEIILGSLISQAILRAKINLVHFRELSLPEGLYFNSWHHDMLSIKLPGPCDVKTGQCPCRKGVTGQWCNQCVSKYAQVTDRGCESE